MLVDHILCVVVGAALGSAVYFLRRHSTKYASLGASAAIYVAAGIVGMLWLYYANLPSEGKSTEKSTKPVQSPTRNVVQITPRPDLSSLPENIRAYIDIMGRDLEFVVWWQRKAYENFVTLFWDPRRKIYFIGPFQDYPIKDLLSGERYLEAPYDLENVLKKDFAITPEALVKVLEFERFRAGPYGKS